MKKEANKNAKSHDTRRQPDEDTASTDNRHGRKERVFGGIANI